MHNLRHFYYQNKEKIWKVVLIIAFLLGLIYYLNDHTIENKNENLYTNNSNVNYIDEQNKTYIADHSTLSGGIVTESEVKKINNTVSKFLQYCKNGEAQQAYNMISNDNKKNEYNTLQEFKEKYLNSRFNKNYTFEIEKWIRDTYKITISKDLLLTGDLNNNEKHIEYITIVEENSKEKLNINNYIGKKDINKDIIQNDIKISALNKKMFLDYEIYEIKIENLSNKTIKLDSLKNSGTMYIQDSNGRKYNAYSHEILEDNLEVKPKETVQISIKYSNTYSLKKDINNLIFENVILDYIKYKNTVDKNNFKDICKINISL